MSATAEEVDMLVDSVPIGSSEAVYRAALETGTRAYQVHRLHIFTVALGIAAASSGSYLINPIFAMWCVLRMGHLQHACVGRPHSCHGRRDGESVGGPSVPLPWCTDTRGRPNPRYLCFVTGYQRPIDAATSH